MRLVHWSHDIVTEVKGRHQTNFAPGGRLLKGRTPHGKPRGFWLSDETRGAYSWRAWCRAERFRPSGFRYEHEVKLTPNAKILYLRSAEDIDKFGEKYQDKNNPMYRFHKKIDADFPSLPNNIHDIDWHRVAKKYHGIIITPYQWSQRLGAHSWYYGWDCASGVIWNPRAIESITMVKERKVPNSPTRWQAARKRKRQRQKMKEMMAEIEEIKKAPIVLRETIEQ